MWDAYPTSTPSSTTTKLEVPTKMEESPQIDAPYTQAVGSLMYMALGIQPDIAFTIQHLS